MATMKMISLERLKEYDFLLKDYILQNVKPDEAKYKDYVIAEGIVVGIDTETGVAKVINPKDAGLDWSYSENLVMPHQVEYNGVTYVVTVIAENAFTDCNCNTVTISESIESIEEYAFYDAIIETLVFEYGESYLTDANIGREAEHIQHLVLNRDITGNYAFAYCTELQTVEIGKYVTSIGNYAFAYCTRLQTVVFYNYTPPTFSTQCFRNVNSVTIYVPAAALQDYMNSNLSNFINDIDWQTF